MLETSALSDADFERVRGLIGKYAGIALAPVKRDLVYARLAKRLRALKIGSFAEYIDLVEGDPAEGERFVNALTTNLTSFFREPHHFEMLAEMFKTKLRGDVRIWSAACSTGEEPYTIAMTAFEAHAEGRTVIVASDIDTTVLDRALKGVYGADHVAQLSRARLERFFERGIGSNAGHVRVRNEVKALVRFERSNLLDVAWPVQGPLDVIFCRNVMIYFDHSTQRRILERMRSLLRPDGILFTGHSEVLFRVGDLFATVGKTAYSPR